MNNGELNLPAGKIAMEAMGGGKERVGLLVQGVVGCGVCRADIFRAIRTCVFVEQKDGYQWSAYPGCNKNHIEQPCEALFEKLHIHFGEVGNQRSKQGAVNNTNHQESYTYIQH